MTRGVKTTIWWSPENASRSFNWNWNATTSQPLPANWSDTGNWTEPTTGAASGGSGQVLQVRNRCSLSHSPNAPSLQIQTRICAQLLFPVWLTVVLAAGGATGAVLTVAGNVIVLASFAVERQLRQANNCTLGIERELLIWGRVSAP